MTAARLSVLGTVQIVAVIGSTLLGYAAGVASYGARVAVLESEVRELSRQEQVTQSKLDAIADRLGAHGADRPAALLSVLPDSLAP